MKNRNLMRKKMILLALISGVAGFIFIGNPISADTSAQAQGDVNAQIASFQSQLNTELSQVNALYGKANASQTAVKKSQEDIKTLEAKITQAQKDEINLNRSISEQMRSIQSSGGTALSIVDIITSSKSLTSMIQKLTNLNIVMTAESDQVITLQDTKRSLENMRIKLVATHQELLSKEKNYQIQVQSLQGDISGLQSKISNNKQLLEKMQAQAAAEQAQREEKIAQAAKASQAAAATTDHADQAANTSNAAPSSQNQPTSSNQPQPQPQTPVTGSRVLTVLATAYSWQEVGTTTAMGIDLRTNPMCIAVDPSVIPLGSLLEVPGYGIAIAGDTGGAIKGNHIDVHLPTTAQASAWGVKTLQIKVLN